MACSTLDEGALVDSILPRGLIDPVDRARCGTSLSLLRQMVTRKSLVLFAGAGVSRADPTGFPTGVELLQILFEQLLVRLANEKAGSRDGGQRKGPVAELPSGAAEVLRSVATRVGFEITLSELRQIWPPAFLEILETWADIAKKLPFNAAHLGLAAWLRAGCTVMTTNYDCFIEEAFLSIEGRYPEVRYWTLEEPPPGDRRPAFDGWREDLDRGGVLFKLHGSFEDFKTCLATLDQVGTILRGPRSELLSYVLSRRPVCFVGWRGADPDIPPIILSARSVATSEPVIWVLYEGTQPEEPFRLADRLDQVSVDLSELASENPIVIEANRLFQGLQDLLQIEIQTERTSAQRTAAALEQAMTSMAAGMPPTGVARFLGICSRRAGEFELAKALFYAAEELGVNPPQRAAAIQERAHVFWQTGERGRALEELATASAELQGTADLGMRLAVDFGELSMTIAHLKVAPSIAGRLPDLLRRYRKDIEAFEEADGEPRQLALHRALYHLYMGRLLDFLASFLGPLARGPISSYILRQFNQAKYHIDRAQDIHLHSKVDVLSYGALALARFDHCDDAWRDFTEAERLAYSLQDRARNEYLRQQRLRLEALCGPREK